MTRKKGKKGPSPSRSARTAPPPAPFNPLFEGALAFPKPTAHGAREGALSGEPIRAPRSETQEDERVFLEAVSDVVPLSFSTKKTVPPAPDTRLRPAHPPPDDELETMTHLYDLVSGTEDLDITFSDEYIEGAVPGFDRRLMLRLKKGEFALQDHIDLHGLTKQEAEACLRSFLIQSYDKGLRCVLIVTGRGLNSQNQIPILKESLPVWLRSGPARKIVLAFSTARPYDGGMGAIYVLLRRRKNPVVFSKEGKGQR